MSERINITQRPGGRLDWETNKEDCHFVLRSLLYYSKFTNKHVFPYYCGNFQKTLYFNNFCWEI